MKKYLINEYTFVGMLVFIVFIIFLVPTLWYDERNPTNDPIREVEIYCDGYNMNWSDEICDELFKLDSIKLDVMFQKEYVLDLYKNKNEM